KGVWRSTLRSPMARREKCWIFPGSKPWVGGRASAWKTEFGKPTNGSSRRNAVSCSLLARDRLDLEIFFQTEHAELSADAGLLVAPEWGERVVLAAVDVHLAGAHAASAPHRSIRIA